MYINFELLKEKDLDIKSVLLLQACSQNRTEDLGEFMSKNWNPLDIQLLYKKGLIEFIKGKKNQSDFSKARTTKRGKDVLDELETPLINADDLKVFDWLEKVYKDSGKEVGNRKKTKMYIALFRVHSQIDRNKLGLLINSFLKDDSQMEYSHRMEYLFFKPSSVFQVKFDIEQSRLYQFYLNNKEVFDNAFKKYD